MNFKKYILKTYLYLVVKCSTSSILVNVFLLILLSSARIYIYVFYIRLYNSCRQGYIKRRLWVLSFFFFSSFFIYIFVIDDYISLLDITKKEVLQNTKWRKEKKRTERQIHAQYTSWQRKMAGNVYVQLRNVWKSVKWEEKRISFLMV